MPLVCARALARLDSVSADSSSLCQMPPRNCWCVVSVKGMSSQFGETTVSDITSLMRLSMALKTIPYVICLELTIGSMLRSSFGIVSKEIHKRLLGGALTLIRRCPSIFFNTPASTRLTDLGLK